MLSKNQLGFLYMFMSVCAFSIMDLIVKWSDSYPLGQVLFFRGFFGLVFYFFIIPRERLKNFYYTKRAGLHFLRCSFGLIALISILLHSGSFRMFLRTALPIRPKPLIPTLIDIIHQLFHNKN